MVAAHICEDRHLQPWHGARFALARWSRPLFQLSVAEPSLVRDSFKLGLSFGPTHLRKATLLSVTGPGVDRERLEAAWPTPIAEAGSGRTKPVVRVTGQLTSPIEACQGQVTGTSDFAVTYCCLDVCIPFHEKPEVIQRQEWMTQMVEYTEEKHQIEWILEDDRQLVNASLDELGSRPQERLQLLEAKMGGRENIDSNHASCAPPFHGEAESAVARPDVEDRHPGQVGWNITSIDEPLDICWPGRIHTRHQLEALMPYELSIAYEVACS
jgi:hypothetical protein